MIFNSGYMVDKFGRRPLLLIGGVGIIVCLVIIGSLAFLPAAGAAGTATVAVMCIWVV
jgi:MFS family permease